MLKSAIFKTDETRETESMGEPAFNEDSRVKIPALLHLTRLGFRYLSLKGATWDKATNIFTVIFSEAMARINPGLEQADISRLYKDLTLTLENEDLGRQFYHKLISGSGERLIDWDAFDNNSFHVVTELPCQKDDESFRPDITVLINGIPLSFIEVKSPTTKKACRPSTTAWSGGWRTASCGSS
ncbi:MAG: type I restriction endonuclease [Cyclobacteriaceae bacterium]